MDDSRHTLRGRMQEANGDGWQRTGKHLLRFEPPNVFITRVHGDVCKSEVETTYTLMQEQIDKSGPIYWITNVTELGSIERDARTVKGPPGRTFRPSDLLGLAFVGASFHQRVLLQLALKANRLLRRDHSPLEMGFFASEDEARAWVEECRRRSARS